MNKGKWLLLIVDIWSCSKISWPTPYMLPVLLFFVGCITCADRSPWVCGLLRWQKWLCTSGTAEFAAPPQQAPFSSLPLAHKRGTSVEEVKAIAVRPERVHPWNPPSRGSWKTCQYLISSEINRKDSPSQIARWLLDVQTHCSTHEAEPDIPARHGTAWHSLHAAER